MYRGEVMGDIEEARRGCSALALAIRRMTAHDALAVWRLLLKACKSTVRAGSLSIALELSVPCLLSQVVGRRCYSLLEFLPRRDWRRVSASPSQVTRRGFARSLPRYVRHRRRFAWRGTPRPPGVPLVNPLRSPLGNPSGDLGPCGQPYGRPRATLDPLGNPTCDPRPCAQPLGRPSNQPSTLDPLSAPLECLFVHPFGGLHLMVRALWL